MPMTQGHTLRLCECCALMVANHDESSCRDYYGHTHRSTDVPLHTVLGDDTAMSGTGFMCDGCHEWQRPFAQCISATVLIPHTREDESR